MPAIIETDETLNQTSFIEKPDMRFGTTFLSYQYRDKAVKGESLMDKITGEIFHKRADNRVVSFFENKRFMYDVAMELKILLTTHKRFKYPSGKEYAFYVNKNYDSMSMNKEVRLNILESDMVIANDSADEYTVMKFTSACTANGFFIKPGTRDSDKAIVEFLTNEYNKLIENYDGTDPNHQLEKAKFEYPGFKESNASLEYTVKVYNDVTVVHLDRIVVPDDYADYDPMRHVHLTEAREQSPGVQVGETLFTYFDPTTMIRWDAAKQIDPGVQVGEKVTVSKTYTVGDDNSGVLVSVNKLVVADDAADFNPDTQIRLTDALTFDPNAVVGEVIYIDATYPVGYPIRINEINTIYFPDAIAVDFPDHIVHFTTNKTVVEDDFAGYNASTMIKLSVAQASFPAAQVGDVIPVNESKTEPGYTKTEVTIKAVRFDKLHYMYNLYSSMSTEWKTLFDHLVALDNKAHIDYYGVSYFINQIEDLEFFGNEMIVTLIDVPYLDEFMNKASALHATGNLILSADRPLRGDWTSGSIWGEVVRTVSNGSVVDTNSETDVKRMEYRLADRVYSGPVNMAENQIDNFLLEDQNSEEDTSNSFATMLRALSRTVDARLENVIVNVAQDQLNVGADSVLPNGMVLQTVDTVVRDDEGGES